MVAIATEQAANRAGSMYFDIAYHALSALLTRLCRFATGHCSGSRYAAGPRAAHSYKKAATRGRHFVGTFPLIRASLFSALCCAAIESTRGGPPDVAAEFTIADNGPLILPVSISKRVDSGDAHTTATTLRMMLDTGASVSAFADMHAGLLGQSKYTRLARSRTGPLEYVAFGAPQLQIGEVVLRPNSNVICFDFSQITNPLKPDIDGLLGMDVLSGLVISIDFGEQRLRLHCSAPRGAGKAIALHRNNDVARNCMFVTGALDGEPELDFLIDTGAMGPNTGSLNDDVFDALLDTGALRASGSLRPVSGANGRAMVIEARSNGFTLGGYRHRGAVFHRLNFPSSLGLDYLSRYKVVFDFPNRTMYLKPGRNFDHVDICDRLGLSLRRIAGTIEVKSVVPAGAAAKVGIEAGDCLLMIDGVGAESLNIRDARRTLSTDGEHVLDLSRRGTHVRVTVLVED